MVTVTEEHVREIMSSDMSNIVNKMKYIFEACGLGVYYDSFHSEEIDLDTLKIMETRDFIELGVDPMDELIINWINCNDNVLVY
jgi:hypothetical protein